MLNNRPVTLGPDSLLSLNTGKGEVDNRGLMLSTLEYTGCRMDVVTSIE